MEQKNPRRSPESRRRALLLVARITYLAAELAHDFPECRGVLETPLESLHRRLTRTPREERDLVLQSIHQGAYTIEELTEETGILRKRLGAILDELVKRNILGRTTRKGDDELGGRPQLIFFPNPNRK